jgi:hypothetical protein
LCEGLAPIKLGKGSGFKACPPPAGSGFKVQGSGFRVQGSRFRVQGSRFRVQGSRFRVQGSGFKVQRFKACPPPAGSRFRVQRFKGFQKKSGSTLCSDTESSEVPVSKFRGKAAFIWNKIV